MSNTDMIVHGLKVSNIRPGSHPANRYCDFTRYRQTSDLMLSDPPKSVFEQVTDTVEIHHTSVIDFNDGTGYVLGGVNKGPSGPNVFGDLLAFYFNGYELSDGSYSAYVGRADVENLPAPFAIVIDTAMQLKLQEKLNAVIEKANANPNDFTEEKYLKEFVENVDIFVSVSYKKKQIVGVPEIVVMMDPE